MYPLKFTHDVTFSMVNYTDETGGNAILRDVCNLPPLVIAANVELFFDSHDAHITHFDHLDHNAGSRIGICRADLLGGMRRAQRKAICSDTYDLPKLAKQVIEAIQRRFKLAVSAINHAQDRTHDCHQRFNAVDVSRKFNAVLPDMPRGVAEYSGGIAIDSLWCAIELMWMLHDGEITIMYRNRQRMLVPLLSLDQMIQTAMDNFTNPALWIPLHDLCISAAVGILVTEHYTLAALQAMTALELAYVDSAVFSKHVDITATHLLFTLHDLQDGVIPNIRYVDTLLHAVTLDAATVNYSQIVDWIGRTYGTYCQNTLSHQSGHMGTIVYGSDTVLDGLRTHIYLWYCYSVYVHGLGQSMTSMRLSEKHHRMTDLSHPFTTLRYTGWQHEIVLYLRRKYRGPATVTFVNVAFVTDTNENRVLVYIGDTNGAGGGGSQPPYGDYDGDSMRDPSWCKPLDSQVAVPPKVATMLAKLGVGSAVCKPATTPFMLPRDRRTRNGRY